MTSLLRAGLVAGLATAVGSAWATPCDSALSSYEFYVSTADKSNASAIVSNHPECFPGGPASSGVQISNTSFLLAYAIWNALALRQSVDGPLVVGSANLKGMAAGAGAGKWNVWGNLTNNDTRQSYSSANGFTAKYNTDVMTSVIGVDYGLSPTMVLGVSGAFDEGDGSGLNTGPGGSRNAIDSKGYLIAPYFGMQLSKTLSFDLSAGLGRGRVDTNTNSQAKADRWFAAANLTYNRWFDNIQLTGKASLLHGEEDYGNIKDPSTGLRWIGTDARNEVDQLRLGVQAGYWTNGVMPFASLAYSNDLRRHTTQFGSPNNPIGRDGWLLGLGVNFYSVKDGLTAGVAYNYELGRNNQDNQSVMANINLRF